MPPPESRLLTSSLILAVVVTVLGLAACSTTGPTPLNPDRVARPVENFEFFWNTLDENYAHFETRCVNWRDIYERRRPSINSNTTNGELFETLAAIVTELDDPHTWIKARDAVATLPPDPLKEDLIALGYDELELGEYTRTRHRRLSEEERRALSDWLAATERESLSRMSRRYFAEPLAFYANDRIGTAHVEDGIAYFVLREVDSLFPTARHYRAERELEALFNRLLGEYGNASHLILDLRGNPGGLLDFAQQIGRHFIESPTPIATMAQRQDGIWSTPRESILFPGRGVHYGGQLVVLADAGTASAAEWLILYLRASGRLAAVVGTRTAGAFSSIRSIDLPNGWVAGFSWQTVYDTDGILLERRGIVPDVPVSRSVDDYAGDLDPQLDAALTFIQKSRGTGDVK